MVVSPAPFIHSRRQDNPEEKDHRVVDIPDSKFGKVISGKPSYLCIPKFNCGLFHFVCMFLFPQTIQRGVSVCTRLAVFNFIYCALHMQHIFYKICFNLFCLSIRYKVQLHAFDSVIPTV